MTLQDFFQKIKDYYGKNDNKEVMKITEAYVSKSYKPESYKKLLNAIYRSHPSSWGYPDVAAVESAHEKFIKSDITDLKESKRQEYKNPIDPLTDEEKAESEESGARDEWEKMLKKNANKSTDDLDPEKMNEIKKELKK